MLYESFEETKSKEEHKLNFESALLPALLLPTGLNFYPNFLFVQSSSSFEAWAHSKSWFLMPWTPQDLRILILINSGNYFFSSFSGQKFSPKISVKAVALPNPKMIDLRF